MDYTYIEISRDDDIEILEIDNNCFDNENKNEENNNKDIIIASIIKDKEIKIQQGILIYKKKCNKFYLNNIEEFSGGTIILIYNLKIIGINYDYEIEKKKCGYIYE